jgi:hypothetical protein
LTQYEKVIKIHEKSVLPPDILGSDLALQSYLEENIIANQKDEKIRLRIAKARQTWTNKRLAASKEKISIEPLKPVNQYQKHPAVELSAAPEQKFKTFIQAREEIEQQARQKRAARKVEPTKEEINE